MHLLQGKDYYGQRTFERTSDQFEESREICARAVFNEEEKRGYLPGHRKVKRFPIRILKNIERYESRLRFL
jgi:hypothetical protein